MDTNEGEVYFALDADDFDLDEVTKFLGIQPTSTMKKGNPIPKNTSWVYSSGKVMQDYIDVYGMASNLISTLEPKTETIIKAINRFKLKPRLEVVLWFTCKEDISTPAIGFDEKTIKFLGEVGAYVDIDTYKG